jgi:hypothetical protein
LEPLSEAAANEGGYSAGDLKKKKNTCFVGFHTGAASERGSFLCFEWTFSLSLSWATRKSELGCEQFDPQVEPTSLAAASPPSLAA